MGRGWSIAVCVSATILFALLPLAAAPKADEGEEVLSFTRTPLHDIGAASFSPRGDRFAIFMRDGNEARWVEHQVWIYDLKTGKRITRLAVNFPHICIGHRADGTLLTCVSSCRKGVKGETPLVQLWDRAGKEMSRYTLPVSGHPHWPDWCVLSPCGERLLLLREGALEVYDAASGKRLGRIPTKANPITVTCAWSPDSKRIAIIGSDNNTLVSVVHTKKWLTVYDLEGHRELSSYDLEPSPGRYPDSSTLLCFPRRGDDLLMLEGAPRRTFRRFDALTGKAKSVTDAKFFHAGGIGGRWLSDGKTVIATDRTHGFALFDIETGKRRAPGPVSGKAEYPERLTVSRDERLVGWSHSWGFKVWRLSKGRPEEP